MAFRFQCTRQYFTTWTASSAARVAGGHCVPGARRGAARAGFGRSEARFSRESLSPGRPRGAPRPPIFHEVRDNVIQRLWYVPLTLKARPSPLRPSKTPDTLRAAARYNRRTVSLTPRRGPPCSYVHSFHVPRMMLVVHSNGLSVRTVTCGARQLWSTGGTHSARLQDQADQAGQQASRQAARAAARPRAGNGAWPGHSRCNRRNRRNRRRHTATPLRVAAGHCRPPWAAG